MIVISPYSSKLPNAKNINAKNYPHWVAVVQALRKKGYKTVQIGVVGEASTGADEYKIGLSLEEVRQLILRCKTWISVDNFLPHLAELTSKRGVVLWGKSDPNIFGYPGNVNLLKSRSYLRVDQFKYWFDERYDPTVFVAPEMVVESVLKLVEAKGQSQSSGSKVSALMVTRNRFPLAQRAIHCFQQQTHKETELIILDNSDTSYLCDYVKTLKAGNIIYHQTDPKGLGALRNEAVKLATGDFLVQWDDDDWYHPQRIEKQLQLITMLKRDACLIDHWTLHNVKQDTFLLWKRPLEGSLMVRRSKMLPYPEMNGREDTALMHQFWINRLTLCNVSDPTLYIYSCHGANTSDTGHFLEIEETGVPIEGELGEILRKQVAWPSENPPVSVR